MSMVSIMVHMRREAMRIAGRASGEAAGREALAHLAADWRKSKKGRKTKTEGNEVFFYFSDFKMAGSAFIDPLPQREAVQPRKGAKA